jgi:hypothetical protein
VSATIAATAICQDQKFSRIRIIVPTSVVPPMAQRITGKLTRITAGTDVHIADIEIDIVNTMRDGNPICKIGKVMVVNFYRFASENLTRSMQLAYELFFLVSMLITG